MGWNSGESSRISVIYASNPEDKPPLFFEGVTKENDQE
jgi:hypothetical protein